MTDPRPALRALEARYATRGRLFLLHLDVTGRCPLDCAHCYLGAGRTAPDGLSTADWLRLMDQARDLQVARLVLSGGEPMARPDFDDLLHGARDRGFAVLVKTTGLLLGEGDADRWARRGWVSADVSLHAAAPAVHDAFVGRPGAWQAAVLAIDRLRDRGIFVRVTRSAVPGAGDDGGALGLWCRQRALPLTESTVNLAGRDRFPASAAQAPAALPVDEQATILARHFDGPPAIPPLPDPDARLCAAGHTRLHVAPDGTVNPCAAWDRPLGHVREGLAAVLAGRPRAGVRALRQGHRTGACRGCDLRALCDFCPGQAEARTGNPLAPHEAGCLHAAALAEAVRRAGTASRDPGTGGPR
jgi:AdoMet-dependent heme synthase